MAKIVKGAKALKLNGTPKNDTLIGGEGNDTLNALAGDDYLVGGAGADKMIGGNGNDYFVVDNVKDVVTETNKNLAIGGNDTIETALPVFTLPANVENLIFTGANSKGFGNALNNSLFGNSGNDTFTGGKGDDFIDGDDGNDTAIFSRKLIDYAITLDKNNAVKNGLIVKYIGKGDIDGTDTLSNIEFLKFSDKTLNVADFINAQKTAPITPPVIETPVNPVVEPVKPAPPIITIPVSTQTYEAKAPFIYQSNDLQNLDSVSALITYNPKVSNGVDYSTSESEQWRTRASDPNLAIDLTQTNQLTGDVLLQGQLDSNLQSQVWYKIHLAQAGALQVQDLSNDAVNINVGVFKNASENSLSYHYSLYDATRQLNSYSNVAAGDYFVRIDKENPTSNVLDFKIAINTQPTDEFIVPTLKFDANNSTMQTELSPTQTEVFYKFKVDSTTTFTLDATPFANQFDIGLIKPLASGGYSGAGYSFFDSAPDKQVYELKAGTYYLDVKTLNAPNNTVQIAIPIVATTPINFNTAFENLAPVALKADLSNAKNAISKDTAGNLELTYTFDLSKILGTEDASPNATPFSNAQQDAARNVLHEYENLAQLKFRELAAGSTEKANFTFTNVSSLGSAAGEASTHQASNGDFSKVVVRIDASDKHYTEVAVGQDGYETLLHEIGHSLGLKHPRSYGSGGQGSELPFLATDKDNTQFTMMSYNSPTHIVEDGTDLNKMSGSVSAKTPLLYDIAAIQKLYGANVNYNANDTIYRWEKNIDPRMSIWDGGGVDTIDVSNQTQKQVIDLRAGEFSSLGAATLLYSDNSTKLYPAKNNVSIAYDTIIENAIGSNQDDKIIGNSVANQLTGSLGKDSFVFASKLNDFNVDKITDFNIADDSLLLDRTIFKALNSGNVLTAQELFVSANATAAENATQRVIFNTAQQSLYYDADGVGGENAMLFALLPNVASLNAGQIFIQG